LTLLAVLFVSQRADLLHVLWLELDIMHVCI